MAGSQTAADLHARLAHPVVDADGHVVESPSVLVEYIRKVAGSPVADRFMAAWPTFTGLDEQAARPARTRPQPGRPMAPWWFLPTLARDRATAYLPRLLRERLDELGIDFTVLYSSVGLGYIAHPDGQMRRGACRGINTYLAEMLEGCQDRMTAAAVIPTHTPDEAIVALEHAVSTLGFRAVMINSLVARPLPSAGEGAQWLDVLALDSELNYDPLWARCAELGVAVTVHTPTMGMALRQSSTSFMFNHIGNFAASSDAFAKAVFFGGVTHRHPGLNFAFLECGVAWGVQLLCDLVDRWEKRGGPNIGRLDPATVDATEWRHLFDHFGGDIFADEITRTVTRPRDRPPDDLDDFGASGVKSALDIASHFERFFFGCEADDATVSWAFADNINPFGAILQPMLGSDIGHWDVLDMREVLPEAYEMIERHHLDPDQFRAFTCDNVIRLHGEMNPRFFDGTPVESYARSLLTPIEVATSDSN